MMKSVFALGILMLVCAPFAAADACHPGTVAQVIGTACTIGGVAFDFAPGELGSTGGSQYGVAWDPAGDPQHPGAGAYVTTSSSSIDPAGVLFVPLTNGHAGFTLVHSLSSSYAGDGFDNRYFILWFTATAHAGSLIIGAAATSPDMLTSPGDSSYLHTMFNSFTNEYMDVPAAGFAQAGAYTGLCQFDPALGCDGLLQGYANAFSFQGSAPLSFTGSSSDPAGFGAHFFNYGYAELSASGQFGGSAQITSATFVYDTLPASVPEPGTLALLGAGCIGLGLHRRVR